MSLRFHGGAGGRVYCPLRAVRALPDETIVGIECTVCGVGDAVCRGVIVPCERVPCVGGYGVQGVPGGKCAQEGASSGIAGSMMRTTLQRG